MSESSLIYCFGHSNNFLYIFIPSLASYEDEDVGVGMMKTWTKKKNKIVSSIFGKLRRRRGSRNDERRVLSADICPRDEAITQTYFNILVQIIFGTIILANRFDNLDHPNQ